MCDADGYNEEVTVTPVVLQCRAVLQMNQQWMLVNALLRL